MPATPGAAKEDPAVRELTRGPEWNGFRGLHGRRQAFRIDRERHLVRQNTGSRETAYGLTSLDTDEAGPKETGDLVRRHSPHQTVKRNPLGTFPDHQAIRSFE